MQAEADLRKAKADRFRKAAEKCVVRASAPGQVIYRGRFREGQTVPAGPVVLRLHDPSRLHAEVLLNATAVAQVTPGTPAVIRLDAFPDQAYAGVVNKVEPLTTTGPGGIPGNRRVMIRLPNPPAQSRPGLTVEATIQLPPR